MLWRAAWSAAGQASIDFTIYRWSTDEEREMLLTTLQEYGRDTLIDALDEDPPDGRLHADAELARLRPLLRPQQSPARRRPQVVSGDQPARRLPRGLHQLTFDGLPVHAIELHLDKDGKGEGKMVPAAKISWDAKKKEIEIENYRAQPIDLINVKAKTP